MNKEIFKDLYKKVYWTEETNFGKEVKGGILLARYIEINKIIYIVLVGDISSTVVRHIDSYYLNNKDAWSSFGED